MDEHCVMGGCDLEFTTTNYGVTTTPSKEYKISTGQLVCDQREMQDKNKKLVRVIKPLDYLKKLELCIAAELTDEEILAVVGSCCLLHVDIFESVRHVLTK